MSKKIMSYINQWMGGRQIKFLNGNENTKQREVWIGLPQGGVLSPLLYSIYTRELSRNVEEKVTVLQYADDIAIYIKEDEDKNGEDKLEKGINIINKHLEILELDLESKKTKYIEFREKNWNNQEKKVIYIRGTAPRKGSHLVVVVGLWLHRGYPLRGAPLSNHLRGTSQAKCQQPC